jgi:hypothetical protein
MRNFSIDQDEFFAGWFKTLWGNSNSLVHNPQHPSPASRLPSIAPCPLRERRFQQQPIGIWPSELHGTNQIGQLFGIKLCVPLSGRWFPAASGIQLIRRLCVAFQCISNRNKADGIPISCNHDDGFRERFVGFYLSKYRTEVYALFLHKARISDRGLWCVRCIRIGFGNFVRLRVKDVEGSTHIRR